MQITRRTVLAGAAAAPALAALSTNQAVAASPARTVSPARTDKSSASLQVGVGISDVTGPVAEVGMMGYSSFDQRAEGLHQRMRARAFIFESGGSRVAYVCVDNCMIFQSVHDEVLRRLAGRFGDIYTERNVMLTAIHSHAACGGASHNYAYNLAVLGFELQVFEAEVNGMVEAISAAHENLAPGTVRFGRSDLTDASVNRSRVAFDLNPEEDKAYYPGGNDHHMRVMRISRGSKDIGAINWFATHCASLTNENHLISGDNKGAAAYFWEHDDRGVRYLDGDTSFIAAFPQTNSGDMSPNLFLEPGRGPTEDEFENARIIGLRQVAAARTAFDAASDTVTGGVDSRIMYLDMANQVVSGRFTPDGREHRTAPAAIGAAMSAGSVEDGPAIPIFPEGTRNPMIDALGGMDAPVPQWLQDAQAPKLVVVPVGLLPPGGWVPNVLKIQILRIGQFYIVGGPAEFTIVSGLRVRRTVADELGVPLENVIFQGYANSYSSYCTTPQEYDSQQYEGGSTMFGSLHTAGLSAGVCRPCSRDARRHRTSSRPRSGRPVRVPTQLRTWRRLRRALAGNTIRRRNRPTRRHLTGWAGCRRVRHRPPQERHSPKRDLLRDPAQYRRILDTGRRRQRLVHQTALAPGREQRFRRAHHVGCSGRYSGGYVSSPTLRCVEGSG